MRTLVLGSSHINSLALARDEASARFGDVRFLMASLWSLCAAGTTVDGDRLALGLNPHDILRNLSPRAKLVPVRSEDRQFDYRRDDGKTNPVAQNVRTFHSPKGPSFQSYDGGPVDLVVTIFYRGPSTDASWVCRFADLDPDLPVSLAQAAEINAFGGRPAAGKHLTWGPHVFAGKPVGAVEDRFCLLDTLVQVSQLYRTARKVLCVPPPKFRLPTDAPTAETAERYARGLEVYAGVLAGLYGALGYEICMFPWDCLDETGVHTDLSWSIKPGERDPHMNARYGSLLWKAIEALALP